MLRFTRPGASETLPTRFGLLRSLRNLARLAAIGLTLARHDALFLFAGVPAIAFYLRLAGLFARRRSSGAARPGQRLAAALDEMGPSFIKLGQLLSTRADLLGEEIATDLAMLQDRLPPFPGRAGARGDRGRVWPEARNPLRLVRRGRGRRRLDRPGSFRQHRRRASRSRSRCCARGSPRRSRATSTCSCGSPHWIERLYPPLRRLKPVEIVRTLAEIVRFEMDLRFEAAAASELAENFAGDPGFRVPRIDWQRTGRGVLTLERIAGIRIDDRAALLAAGHRIEDLLAKAAGAFFNQVFRDGFFHADMHPGNMFVAADGAIAVVDFGIMGRLDRATR